MRWAGPEESGRGTLGSAGCSCRRYAAAAESPCLQRPCSIRQLRIGFSLYTVIYRRGQNDAVYLYSFFFNFHSYFSVGREIYKPTKIKTSLGKAANEDDDLKIGSEHKHLGRFAVPAHPFLLVNRQADQLCPAFALAFSGSVFAYQ